MNIANNITELIGNTPLVKLNHPSLKSGATILGKCEFMNPTSSVKDRIGFNMIKDALDKGLKMEPIEGEGPKDQKIAVVGAGPSGLLAAGLLAEHGLALWVEVDGRPLGRRGQTDPRPDRAFW